MKRIHRAFLSILMASMVIYGCQSSKSSTASKMLKFNFEKGQAYDYEMIVDMDQSIGGMDQEMTMTTLYGMKVTDDVNKVKTITTTFDAFKMNMKVMGMTIEVDSEKPISDTSMKNPLNMVNRMFSAIKGQQFIMKVNEEGKVLEVSGMKEMAAALLDSLQVDEAEKAQMSTSFNQQFNDENIKEQFERAFFIFPNKEVKVGDTWTKTTTALPGSKNGFATTYTVDEIEGEMVTLKLKGDISSSESGTTMKGDQSGEMVVDSRSGLIMTADLDMDVVVTADGQQSKIKAKSRIKGRAR